jgi:glycosyltransferase involved in cell wall biosynthesis
MNTGTRVTTAPGSSGAEILFVIGTLEVGGTERHIATLAPALVKLGWPVSVYSLAGGGVLQEAMEGEGVNVLVPPFRLSAPRSSVLARLMQSVRIGGHLFSLMRSRRPAIVHCFLPAAYLVGAPAALSARIPIRIMSRRSLNVYQRSYPLVADVERRLHRRMTAILGNSRSVVRELNELERVPARRLGLIYNGIDVSRFTGSETRAATRTALGIGLQALTLVMVGNLIAYKGHGDLLAALGQAAPQLPPDWRLLIVGRDEGIASALQAQSVALGIDRNVLFLDTRNDVPDILNACDIGVLCSHQEGFSNAVLEGMAASLPMIVTNVGGNAEAVLDGECGIVVPPSDPPRLAEAIVRLAKSPELRTAFGGAARRRVTEHFSLESSVEAYDAMYRALLSGAEPQDIPEIRVEDWLRMPSASG